MSTSSIVKLIGEINIAGTMSEEKLNLIAADVVERANQDRLSMT